jgi:arginyl-tRNA synthetase
MKQCVVAAYCSPVAPAGQGDEGKNHAVVVRSVELNDGGPLSLATMRVDAVSTAVTALLAARGFTVHREYATAPVVPSRANDAAVAWLAADEERVAKDPLGRIIHIVSPDDATRLLTYHSFLTTRRCSWADRVETATVGTVEVPNGALRARHGGVVYVNDLVSEISDGLVAHAGEPPNRPFDDDLRGWCERYAGALLRYLLLRTERSRHISLQESKLYGDDFRVFARVVAALRIPDAPAIPDGTAAHPLTTAGDRALRSLLLHLNLLPATVARSTTQLEPAFIVRFVTGLVARGVACRGHVPAGDALWLAFAAALDRGLALSGMEPPRPLGETADLHLRRP